MSRARALLLRILTITTQAISREYEESKRYRAGVLRECLTEIGLESFAEEAFDAICERLPSDASKRTRAVEAVVHSAVAAFGYEAVREAIGKIE
jgi:hypothetical protein